ncbi:ATP synthase subunit g, mitochondrial-like [Lineus longissimus]|uniref:ATP synthase subunit g, mitochondrial-like n=1 Tax=Lineus longissimus TaxID=88925 RepID=UPI002B4EBD35
MAQAAQKLVGVGAKLANSLATKGPATAQKIVAFGQPRLMTFWKYAKVEMMPPMPSEFPAVQQGFMNLIKSAQKGKWMTVTMKEAAINTAITAEIAFWFFVGEQIGRGSVVGYYIPGAVHYDPGI